MKAKTKKQLSEKISTQKLVIGALSIVFVISALLFGGRGLLAATDSRIEQKLSEAVIVNALQNPESEVALVLAKYILVSEQGVLANLEAKLAGAQEKMIGTVIDGQPQMRSERVCSKYSDSDFRFVCEGWGRVALPTATTTASEVSRLGFDAIVDYAEVELTGTVSSTFKVYAGTATSTFVDYDATAGGIHALPDNMIDGYEFVTSTLEVDAAGRLDSYRNIINSINDAGTLGVNTVPLPDDGAIVVFLQDDNNAACGSLLGAGNCEQVTSTNRGYAGFLVYHYKYEIDL